MAQCPVHFSGWLGVFVCLAVFLSRCPIANGKKIFCYYSSFAYNRHGRGNFVPEDINPHLCSHIIYAFVDISPDGRGLTPFNENDQGPEGLYSRTLALKKANPSLKVLLAVGGWLIGSEPFLPVVRSEASRAAFIQNVIAYLRRHGFDGFDMDWEFPATRGSPPQDKFRFTQLMKGLYEAFAAESADTGREKLLLTMATASGSYYISQSYEAEKIIHYLDYMLLMTYNYHGQWEKVTGHHSGLYPHRHDPKHGEKAQLYQEWSIDFWLNAGISKDRLIVGIPTYAMTFTLSDQSQHGVQAPAVTGGNQGEFTRETGILAYYEVCDRLENRGWRSEWIEEQGVPFAYGGDQWAGYENKRSVTLKAKNILKRDLGGAFVWSVEMGDFDGVCGEGPYPLLQAINDVISNGGRSEPASRGNQLPVDPISHPDMTSSPEPTGAENSVQVHSIEETKTESRPRVLKKQQGRLSRKKAQDINLDKERHVNRKNVESKTEAPVTETTPMPSIAHQDTVEMKTPLSSSRKIKWKPGIASKRHRKKVVPSSGDHNKFQEEQDQQFHSTASISRMRAHKETHNEANGAKPDEQEATWWFRPSPRPITVGWTKLVPSRRRAWTSSHPRYRGQTPVTKAATKDVALTPSAQSSKELHHEKEQASASASAKGSVHCPPGISGLMPHSQSCDHYVICQAGSLSEIPSYVMRCPAGTKFDSRLRICNFADKVTC